MKRNILHTLWAAAVLLTACTQEELPLPDTNNAVPLTITITDGGYALTTSAGKPLPVLPRTVTAQNSPPAMPADSTSYVAERWSMTT